MKAGIKVTCPWCLELIDKRGSTRFHFDKCPLKTTIEKLRSSDRVISNTEMEGIAREEKFHLIGEEDV